MPITNCALFVIALAISTLARSTTSLVQAGEVYFHSKSISADGAISCASCHSSTTAFQDTYERALARAKVLARNTPTLLNVHRYNSFFWDGRANSLTEQINGPLFSRIELGSSEKLLTEFTLANPLLQQSWRKSELPIVEFVQKSLAEYMLSNTLHSTRFELFMRKAGVTLSNLELKGWKLFSGKFQCIKCHALPNLTDNKFYDIGLPKRRLILQTHSNSEVADRYELGFDYGRANISEQARDLHAFRTPSLYHVMETAPYMHNGIFHSIEEVIDFYSRQRVQLGFKSFSRNENQALIAFLKTLSRHPVEKGAVISRGGLKNRSD